MGGSRHQIVLLQETCFGQGQRGRQRPDHVQGQVAPASQQLGNTAASNPKHRAKIVTPEAEVIHPDLNRLNRVWQFDGMILILVSLDEDREQIQPISIGRSLSRTPEALHFGKGSLVSSPIPVWQRRGSRGHDISP